MAGTRKFFDNSIVIAVITAIVAAFGSGLQAQAVAATLPPPGYGTQAPQFQVEPGKTFSQQVMVSWGTTELRLGGYGIGMPSVRGFRAPVVTLEGDHAPVVTMKSIASDGVSTNGNYHLLITAPMAPGVYQLLFSSCGRGKPWRSSIWYEVVAKNGDVPLGTDAQDDSAPVAPHIGDAAPPIRLSVVWGSNRTLGQDPPKDGSMDYGFGRLRAAVAVAPNTDLRLGLAGGLAKPSLDGSPYGWGDWIGPELSLARQFGNLEASGGFRWMANSSFSGQWTDTPLAAIGDLGATSWLWGWFKPETELALSPRSLGYIGKAKFRITPASWPAHLALVGGLQGAQNLESGKGWLQGLAQVEGGLETAIGNLEVDAGIGFGGSKPTTLMLGVGVWN